MKYELRNGTRDGKYFIDKIKGGEGFTILKEGAGIWEQKEVNELEELIEDANKVEELEDYVLYVRNQLAANELPLSLEGYRDLLEQLDESISVD